MEHIVKIVAPRHFGDFIFKLIGFLLLCGLLNHIRDVSTHGLAHSNPYFDNLTDATWTALPMCTLGLLLIKHLNALQRQLYKQATQDPLTQIPNRRWFFDSCGSRIAAGTSLVLLDVDHFKKVNDAFGHDVGDICLKAIVKHIDEHLHDSAYFARLGGEEFAVFFPQTDVDLEARIQMICAGTSVQLVDHDPLSITLSAGIYKAVNDTNVQIAFRLADKAMYKAKSAGRAQFALVGEKTDGQSNGQMLAVRRSVA